MSIKAVKWALNAQNLSHIKKLVLITLAECHNEKTGKCFPSQQYIAEIIGQSDRSVRSHLGALEADGFFERKHQYDAKWHRDRDVYILNFEISEPTGKHVSGSLPENMFPVGDARLPENSESLPEKIDVPTGNLLSGTNEPEENRNIEPEKESAAADATALARVAGLGNLSKADFDAISAQAKLTNQPIVYHGPCGAALCTFNPDGTVVTAEAQADNVIVPELVDSFDTFWDAWPSETKVKKPRARMAYARALKKASADAILAGLERYKRTKPDWQNWAHPASWLNDERWSDEPVRVRNRRGNVVEALDQIVAACGNGFELPERPY
jgi:hypothetical protein